MSTNEKNINWTTILLALGFGVIMWLIPSPLHRCPNNTASHIIDTVYVSVGNTDTSSTPLPSITGGQTSVVAATETDSTSDVWFPYYFYTEVQDTAETGERVRIESYTFPFKEGDTLKAETQIFYDIQPRSAITITRVDTVFKMITVPEARPFYEEPLFVIPATASATLGLVYIISQILK